LTRIKGTKVFLQAKSLIFRAAKLNGFTVNTSNYYCSINLHFSKTDKITCVHHVRHTYTQDEINNHTFSDGSSV